MSPERTAAAASTAIIANSFPYHRFFLCVEGGVFADGSSARCEGGANSYVIKNNFEFFTYFCE